jgi:hypothetical protein
MWTLPGRTWNAPGGAMGGCDPESKCNFAIKIITAASATKSRTACSGTVICRVASWDGWPLSAT